MAYQNIGTSRFYISLNEYLNSLGALTTTPSVGTQDVSSISRLNPSNQITITDASEEIDFLFSGIDSFLSDKGYFAILGHNFATQSTQFSLTDPGGTSITETEIINSNPTTAENMTHSNNASHDGFTIFSCNYNSYSSDSTGIRFRVSGSPDIGCVSFGNYYDMPHSPDLSLKLSYEYDGVKTIQSKGGATLSNASYTKPADWGDMGAWQLGENTPNYRSGRRVWDLSFSYLSDSDIFPVVASTNNLESSAYTTDSNLSDDTLLEGTDFFSQVWNKTMGGHLPFIFQPDGGAGVSGAGNFNPDQFAICRFDMKTLTYDQVANNVYNVKLKIREVW